MKVFSQGFQDILSSLLYIFTDHLMVYHAIIFLYYLMHGQGCALDQSTPGRWCTKWKIFRTLCPGSVSYPFERPIFTLSQTFATPSFILWFDHNPDL